jgi:hypothetical protein
MTEKFNAANDNANGANDNIKFGINQIKEVDSVSKKPANSNSQSFVQGSVTRLEKDLNLYAINNDYDEVLKNSPLLKVDLSKEGISKEDFQILLNKKVWAKMGEGKSENDEQTWVLGVSQNSNLLTPQERVDYANLRIRIPVSKISTKPLPVNVK